MLWLSTVCYCMFALSLVVWALTQLLKYNDNNNHRNLRRAAALPTGCWHQLSGNRREGLISKALVPKFKFTIFIFKAQPKVGKGLPHASEIMTSHDSYMLPRQWICQPQQRGFGRVGDKDLQATWPMIMECLEEIKTTTELATSTPCLKTMAFYLCFPAAHNRKEESQCKNTCLQGCGGRRQDGNVDIFSCLLAWKAFGICEEESGVNVQQLAFSVVGNIIGTSCHSTYNDGCLGNILCRVV